MGSTQTRKLLKKLDQNFHTLVQCEHCPFNRRAQELRQKIIPPVSKFLKDGVKKHTRLNNEIGCVSLNFYVTRGDIGCRHCRPFFKKFSSPPKNIKPHNSAFSLAQEAQRKSLAKRKRRNYGATRPKPSQAFEKA